MDRRRLGNPGCCKLFAAFDNVPFFCPHSLTTYKHSFCNQQSPLSSSIFTTSSLLSSLPPGWALGANFSLHPFKSPSPFNMHSCNNSLIISSNSNARIHSRISQLADHYIRTSKIPPTRVVERPKPKITQNACVPMNLLCSFERKESIQGFSWMLFPMRTFLFDPGGSGPIPAAVQYRADPGRGVASHKHPSEVPKIS